MRPTERVGAGTTGEVGTWVTFAQTQVGNGDEIGCCPEALGSALDLLHQAVHDLDKGVAAVIEHAAHDRFEVGLERGCQVLERV